MARTNEVHGECVHDGDTSNGEDVTLYCKATTTERTLGSDEYLVVTDLTVFSEDGGDIYVCADSKAAGRYLFAGNLAANGGESRTVKSPYVCPKGTGLKLFGANANLDTCIIEGRIAQA